MNLSGITLQEVGREVYIDSFFRQYGRPGRNEKGDIPIIWSEINDTLIYPTYVALLDDFMRSDYSRLIFARAGGEVIKKLTRKMRSGTEIDEIVDLLHTDLFDSFLELKLSRRALFPNLSFPREIVLTFGWSEGAVLNSISMPYEYREWLNVQTKTPDKYRYNNGILTENPTFVPFEKK